MESSDRSVSSRRKKQRKIRVKELKKGATMTSKMTRRVEGSKYTLRVTYLKYAGTYFAMLKLNGSLNFDV
jgi:hypothetical protein